jgi:hypothetical protein
MNFKQLARPCLAACLACSAALAQSGNGLDNLEWKELPTPPAPSFSIDRMVLLEMPPHVTLKVGIDPDTVLAGEDGVVRYAVVMVNATGSMNALYEGIRCASREVKTYARAGSSGNWNLVVEPQWKGLNDNMPSKHAMAFARQAACDAQIANSRAEILQRLKSGAKAGPAKAAM